VTFGLQKSCIRTIRFLSAALAWRLSNRHFALVAWCLIAGEISLVADLRGDPIWPAQAAVGFYFLMVLAMVCAIDARYGIIPNRLVLALAIGGAIDAFLPEGPDLLWRSLEALSFFFAACLFRATYRYVRGFDGLGFGDVKFATAGVIWIGIEAVPEMLLMAVVSALASLIILRTDGQRLSGKEAIAFGPHLAIGMWLSWILGPLPFSF
jgi:leader peptidase (prepilin peptidase)/N-methyltransferase